MDGQQAFFAQALSAIREAKKLSQQQLAELIGYTRNYIYYLETGQRGPPSRRFIRTLCQALALSPMESGALFKAAGYAPSQPIPRDTLADARALLAPYLRSPIAACAVDGNGAIFLANRAADYLLEVDITGPAQAQWNILLLLLDTASFGGRVVNWQGAVIAHELLLQSLIDLQEDALPEPWWQRHPLLGRLWHEAPSRTITADLWLNHSQLGMIALNIAPTYSPQAPGLLALTYLPIGTINEAFFQQLHTGASSFMKRSSMDHP
jgi:transcriptional regulator with XRE-family HTH domain